MPAGHGDPGVALDDHWDLQLGVLTRAGLGVEGPWKRHRVDEVVREATTAATAVRRTVDVARTHAAASPEA